MRLLLPVLVKLLLLLLLVVMDDAPSGGHWQSVAAFAITVRSLEAGKRKGIRKGKR